MALPDGSLKQEAIKLHSSASWYELWEIRTTESTGLLFTSQPDAITFNKKTYVPWPIMRTEIVESTEGRTPVLQLTVSNIDRAIQDELEQNGIGSGNRVFMRRVHSSYLNTAAYVQTHRFRLIDAIADEMHVVLYVGHENVRQIPVGRPMNRNRCWWEYGGLACGASTSVRATCDRTLLGANGCKAYGTAAVAVGYALQWPANFGGGPGLAKGPFLV